MKNYPDSDPNFQVIDEDENEIEIDRLKKTKDVLKELDDISALKESLRYGFYLSQMKKDDLDGHFKNCEMQWFHIQGPDGLEQRKAVRITPRILQLPKRKKCTVLYEAIIYAHGQAIYTDFDVALYEMCKIAILTKTVVFGIDYRTPEKEGDDAFVG